MFYKIVQSLASAFSSQVQWDNAEEYQMPLQSVDLTLPKMKRRFVKVSYLRTIGYNILHHSKLVQGTMYGVSGHPHPCCAGQLSDDVFRDFSFSPIIRDR